mmetsp:Transcript_49092/g.116930  ORF Transcript_49092/g.116930 Transcript_49092/m.116930 type:complete len:360 (-) Transcript_49092:356-1435(-)
MFTSVSSSMSRVSTLFARNDMYKEQSDLFNDDDHQSWPEPHDRRLSGEKAVGPWSRTEAEHQAASVKAMLQSELRREKPLGEAESPQLPPERSERERRRHRRRDEGGAVFDFPQDWLAPTKSPVQRSAERADVWPPVTPSTQAASPIPTHAWPMLEKTEKPQAKAKSPQMKERSRSGPERCPGAFDEAILEALAALPRDSLVDVLRQLRDRRPEEASIAFGNSSVFDHKVYIVDAADKELDYLSPVSTATGMSQLSPPASEVTGRGRSSSGSPAAPVAVTSSKAVSERSGSFSVAEVVAAAADAAGESPAASQGQGWPADISWPAMADARASPAPWPQLDVWPALEASTDCSASTQVAN